MGGDARGGFVVGVTSLTIGYLMRRRTLRRERQRRQALTLAIRRVGDRRVGAVPLQAARRRAPLARATHEALAPVGLVRRVRVT